MTLASYTSSPFTYPGGGIAAGVPVRVYFSDTSVNVAIYHDAGGAVLKTNPTRTDNAGVVTFWVEPGTYDLWANGAKTTIVVTGPVDPPDPSDFITLAQAEALDDAVLVAAQDYADSVAAPPDLTPYLKGPGSIAEQFFTWGAAARWATFDLPYSAGDSNPDFLRIRNGSGSGKATTPWRVNGNGENRFEASGPTRHGVRAFEFPDGSTDLFGSFSTNPTDYPNTPREYLFGMRGSAAGVRPGYGVFTRGIETPALRLNGVDAAPGAWTAPDLSGSSWVAEVSGTYYALQFRIEGEYVVGSGRVILNTPTNYVANARILTLPAGMFPAKTVPMFMRTGGTGAVAGFGEVSNAGVFSFGTALTVSSAFAWIQFDTFRMRRF